MKNGKYLTAKEKENIAKAFERFVKNGFKRTQFTKALYNHLHLYFGFIAHFDIDGFYSARFQNPQGRVQTFQSILNAGPWTYKDGNTSGNADLNEAILKTVQGYSDEVGKAAKAEHAENLAVQISALQRELHSLKD